MWEAVLALVCAAATASAQEKPAAPGQMNMADHRGALQGRVRNATGAPVPDTEVTGDQRRERCAVQCRRRMRKADTHSGPFRWANTTSALSSTGGLTTFRRRGVDIAMDGKVTLDITLDAASAAAAAEFERPATAAEDRHARDSA